MRYTLRHVPPSLALALRRLAEAEGISLNEAALRALARGVGIEKEGVRRRYLGDIAGTWQEDSEFDRAIADLDVVDADVWR